MALKKPPAGERREMSTPVESSVMLAQTDADKTAYDVSSDKTTEWHLYQEYGCSRCRERCINLSDAPCTEAGFCRECFLEEADGQTTLSTWGGR